MVILLDNGHGVDTAGKRSPDGRLREYKWARELAVLVERGLRAKGLDARRIVTEDKDISLSERCRRVNAVCGQYGKGNVLLVSIHNNAAGDGSRWMSARGFTAWVYTGAGKAARELALIFQTLSGTMGLNGNRSIPARMYFEAGFYILKHTACAAVLTENLFQDNREDVEFLLSDAGKAALSRLHVDAICKYLGVK